MIPDFKTYIKESIWSNINKRSEGNLERKEDDINHLNRDGLYEHIFDLYKPVNLHPLPLKSQTSQAHTYFSIPVFKSDYTPRIFRLDASFQYGVITNITLMATISDAREFKQALQDNFKVTIRDDDALRIEGKNGEMSNQICMDVIKVILENASHPLLKKRD